MRIHFLIVFVVNKKLCKVKKVTYNIYNKINFIFLIVKLIYNSIAFYISKFWNFYDIIIKITE